MPIEVPTLDTWRKSQQPQRPDNHANLPRSIETSRVQAQQQQALPALQPPAPGSHPVIAPPERFMEEAFLKAVTGYDLAPGKWKPEDELVGSALGEVVGFIGVARGLRLVGPALKGYASLRRVRSAKSSAQLFNSPRGAKVISSLGKSRFLHNLGTDLGIEAAFQTGKLGVGFGTGTETRTPEEGAKYAGGILGIVGGFHVGAKIAQKAGGAAIRGTKTLLTPRKSPEEVLSANKQGEIVPPEDINPAVIRPKAAEERILASDTTEYKNALNEVRSSEILDAQIDTMQETAKRTADEVLPEGSVPEEPKDFIEEDWFEGQRMFDEKMPEDIDLAEDMVEGTGLKPQGIRRMRKEFEEARTREVESGSRRLARAWYGDSIMLHKDLDHAVKKGNIKPEDAERLLDRKNKSLYLTNASRTSLNRSYEIINEFTLREQEDLSDYITARALKDSKIRYRENTGEELFDGVDDAKLDEALLFYEGAEANPGIRQAADKINIWANEHTLKPLLDEGMISPQAYEKLAKDQYLPRIYFHLDTPEIADLPLGEMLENETAFLGGNISKLAGGPAEGPQPFIGDIKTLLTHMIEATNKSVERNKQARVLWNVLEGNPKNGLVKPGRTAINSEGIEEVLDPETGFGEAIFRQAGLEPQRMQVDLDLLRDLEKTDPLIARGTLQLLNNMSLSTPLKSATVQNNPAFATFANPFLEIFSQVMGDYRGAYSSFLPKALFYEIPKEFITALPEAMRGVAPNNFARVGKMLGKEWDDVAPEVAIGKGPTIDLGVKHGLNVRGISYINNPENYTKGRPGLELNVKGAKSVFGRRGEDIKDRIFNFSGGTTSLSESVFRLMLFRRHIRLLGKQADISEAEVLKRPELLDRAARYSNEYFSPGDSAPAFRLMEPIAPFISVGQSIFRGQMRAAKKNPKLWGARLAQFGLASATLGVINRLNNPNEWASISEMTKANNIIMFLPKEHDTIRDDGSVQKYYLRIPKDAVSAPVANMFDAMIGGAFFNEDPSERMLASFSKGYRMLNPLGLVSPAVSAGFAFMNYSTFQKREVWNEMQMVNPEDEFHLGRTSKIAYDFGQKTGLSPAKTEAAFSAVFGDRFNTFLNAAGYAYREMSEENPLFPNEGEARNKSVREAKGLSRIIRPVPRLDSDAFKAIEASAKEAGSKRKRVKDQMDTLFKYQQRTQNNPSFSKAEKLERQRLFDKRFKGLVKQIGPEDRTWFVDGWKYLKQNGSLQYLTYYEKLRRIPETERGRAAYGIYKTFETPEARQEYYRGLAVMKLRRSPQFNKQFLEEHRRDQGTPLFPRREQ